MQRTIDANRETPLPFRNIQILCIVMLVCYACYIQAERLKYASKIGHAIQLIENNYVEERDPDELLEAAMQGIVEKLDEFSAYIPPIQYEQFQSGIEQEFGGIGIMIEGPPTVKQLTVVTPIPNTPAFRAGLQPGDVITSIDGQSTEGLVTDEASKLMRGPVGKTVQLTLRRPGTAQVMTKDIMRADIQVDSVYGDRIQSDSEWDFFLREDSRVAYLRVTQFGEKTTGEFLDAIKQIKPQAEALVIDLRYNPGGILSCAVELCDMLVDEGLIVSTRGRKDMFKSEIEATASVDLNRGIPIVVMVNGQSASASEIMAGCLQDLGRAKIAGTRSYGKGTVQRVFPLASDTALKFTTARFYRPSGTNIHRTKEMTEDDEWGISPEANLTLETTDMQELNLLRRWRRHSDPRITTNPDRPPAPKCAGDPQLLQVLEHLQEQLDQAEAIAAPAKEVAE
ncbi:MAG: S41 family peptidase [Planctomycetota bacterium]|nr:S41 family peptidase [Planctomycetota bacterium]